jgi:FAD/FMN-containing dehydrogenase
VGGDLTAAAEFGAWGGVSPARQRVLAMRDRTAALPRVEGTLLPYGLGRSYGDSCLNDGQSIVSVRGMDRFIGFDASTGLLRCESGVSLGEIVEFALPRGWFLPVTPGTRFVTVGGAIANDVHGKNHHRDGTFGHHVRRFELLRSDGSRRECAPGCEEALFRATIGGLGLTGLITWAEIALIKVPGPWILQGAERFATLDEFHARCMALEGTHRYVVAWLDCAGRTDTRGVLFAGNHHDSPAPAPRAPRRVFPFRPGFSLVAGPTVRAFNGLYYRVPRAPASAPRPVPCERFFYPLDAVEGWNRIYGTRGFYQYQCAVPSGDDGKAALAAIMSRIAASGQGSFLGVLKRFGDLPGAGLLSFPLPGYTLALDFPNQGEPTLTLFDSLDAIVRESGGRVYPAKDARMSSASFQAFYPQWEAFAAHVDPAFSSSFWRRVAPARAA